MRVSSVSLAALLATLVLGTVAEANPYRRGPARRHGRGYGVRLVAPPVYVAPPRVYRTYAAEPVYVAQYYQPPPPRAPRRGYYPPPQQVYAAPAPPVATFGLGLRASALSVGRDAPGAGGLGVVLRFRGRVIEGELELGQDRFEGDSRTDTRLGAALIIPIVRGSELAPYLLFGGGVNSVHFDGLASDRTQGYLAVGGGLEWHLSPTFDLSADVRGYARKFVDDRDVSDVSAYFPVSGDDRENAIEGRVTGILYF